MVRRDGKLTQVPLFEMRREVDFGRGPRTAINIPWGDVSTAYYSTGIPNIENYIALPKSVIRMTRLARPVIANHISTSSTKVIKVGCGEIPPRANSGKAHPFQEQDLG